MNGKVKIAWKVMGLILLIPAKFFIFGTICYGIYLAACATEPYTNSFGAWILDGSGFLHGVIASGLFGIAILAFAALLPERNK